MESYGIQKAESINVVRARLVIVHIGAIAAFFVPFNWTLVALLAATWFPRMFGVEAGYHRYFSHRAFKTSRWFQFLLAALGASSGQRGALWWAAHHRTHHRCVDDEGDVHSPVHGFWHSHVGWLVDEKNGTTDLDAVPDFAKYPELRLLNRFYHVPMLLLLAGLVVGGAYGWFGPDVGAWQAVLWGFFLSTTGVLHATLAVNSIAHSNGRFGGRRRYNGKDWTVNHAWLAIPSTGASWHNNHHRYGASARAGFAWYEVDLSYIGLKFLESCRLVWDLRPVPVEILREGGLAAPERERAAA